MKTIHPQAKAAIRAARNWTAWGRFAAMRYCEARNVPPSLLTLARQLEAVKGL
jgi:hypothetical protein